MTETAVCSRLPPLLRPKVHVSMERLEPALTPKADRQGVCLGVNPVDQLYRRGPQLKNLTPRPGLGRGGGLNKRDGHIRVLRTGRGLAAEVHLVLPAAAFLAKADHPQKGRHSADGAKLLKCKQVVGTSLRRGRAKAKVCKELLKKVRAGRRRSRRS